MGPEETEEDIPDSVDLIASGYEWTCPLCEHLNKLPAIPDDSLVECRNPGCAYVFNVGSIHHAMD